jgi:hypothetical protein
MIVDRQGTLTSGLVLDGHEHIAVGIEQIDCREMRNPRQFFQIFRKL